ncbi:hypothetical protein BC835DRAFT_1308600 [Cytidiella melzeri]|nr:hypothetical protein BC835DRAFT_1308600 [Cytidiella melzeri]
MVFTAAKNPQQGEAGLTSQQKRAMTLRKNAEKEQEKAALLEEEIQLAGPRPAKVKAPGIKAWADVVKGNKKHVNKQGQSTQPTEPTEPRTQKKRKDHGGNQNKDEPAVVEPWTKRSKKNRVFKSTDSVDVAASGETAQKTQSQERAPTNSRKRPATRGRAVDARADSPTLEFPTVASQSPTVTNQARSAKVIKPAACSGKGADNLDNKNDAEDTGESDKEGSAADEVDDDDRDQSDIEMLDLARDEAALATLLSGEIAQWQDSDDEDHRPPKFQRRHSRHSSQSSLGLGYLAVDDSDVDAADTAPNVQADHEAHEEEVITGNSMSRKCSTRTKSTKGTKAKAKQRDEAPQFTDENGAKPDPAPPSSSSSRPRLSTSSDAAAAFSNRNPPPDTSIGTPANIVTASTPSATAETLNTQLREIVQMVKVPLVLEHVRENGAGAWPLRPDIVTRDQMLQVARSLGYTQVVQLIQHNFHGLNAKSVRKPLRDHVSQFRGNVKQVAGALVPDGYSITGLTKEGRQKLIKTYLFQEQFLFLCNVSDDGALGTDKAKLFQHPTISSVIAQAFFKGDSSIGKKMLSANNDVFGPEGSQMVTDPMICLASAAIGAALSEWSSGCQVPLKFDGSVFAPLYRRVEQRLARLRSNNEGKYLQLKRKFFRVAMSHHSQDFVPVPLVDDADYDNMSPVED